MLFFKNERKNCFLIALVLIIAINTAFSLGISPGRIYENFEASTTKEFTFTIINGEDKTIKVNYYVSGDLTDYISLEKNEDELKPYENKEIKAIIKYPNEISPGLHILKVGVIEATKSSSMVGGRVGVESQILIFQKYPGKYLEAEIKVKDGVVNEPVNIDVTVTHKGEVDIDSVSTIIDIYNVANEKINTLQLQNFELKAGESKTLNAKWDKPDKAGEYTAKALITYDGAFTETNYKFKVGEYSLNINNVTVSDLKKGSIGKFDIEVESLWGGEIENVYAQINISNKIIHSEKVNIPAWSKQKLTVYWDPVDFENGKYKALLTIYFGDKSITKQFEIEIKNNFNIYYIIGSLLLLAIIIILTYKIIRMLK